jgi:dynein heavy chain
VCFFNKYGTSRPYAGGGGFSNKYTSCIKEEGFLEYINNVLASGLVSNLFSRDEQAEVVTELLPIMKRECPKIPPTPENAMAWFLDRVKANLHVVLCFSPVGEKFRSRALKFPGLTSGQ